MPSPRRQSYDLHHGSLLISSLFFHLISAQTTNSAAAPSDNPDLGTDPTAINLYPAAASSVIGPSPTDNAGYAGTTTADSSNGNGDGGHNDGVLNYYFLLLAVFVIILVLGYWIIARRRRTKNARSQIRQQDALAMDLERWPGGGRRWGAARWRFHNVGGEMRGEEGLDERGEAPPPYLAKPDPVHRGGGESVDLGDLRTVEGKPPGYEYRA